MTLKKFAVLLVLIPLAAPVFAMDWVTANQLTVGWDPVTADGAISYNVYTRNIHTGTETLAGNTTETQFTVTFAQEGRFVIGVETVRVPEFETEPIVSDLKTWSDSADPVAVPVPFGSKYYVKPFEVTGLRPVEE